jgi:DNA-binding NtrC family response regulator
MRVLPSSGSPATVLVVDDEPFVRVVVAEALSEAGYFTVEAENAEAALDLLNSELSIDVLITDVHLPDRHDGHHLAIEAYGLRPDLRVIFMTGDDHMARRFKEMPDTADGVLMKPFSLDELWKMVRGLFEEQAKAA